MRYNPDRKYIDQPCSYVSVGTGYEDITWKIFKGEMPEGLKKDGYLTLEAMNRFIRNNLLVRKRDKFVQGQRPLLHEFLKNNTECCIVCVKGHYVYVRGENYWSFFYNDNDEVINVWYLREEQ